MKHKLPKLGYAYNALEPFIDEKTMKIHHTKHHQAYIDKLNTALSAYPKLKEKQIERLIITLNRVPKKIRTAVKNNAGGHLNHSFFWLLLKKNTKPKARILKEINKTFGNFDNFKQKFTQSSLTLFGSGWTWLILSPNNKLKITTTPNQDNPLTNSEIPILALDLWEHAYYLKYKNKRTDYIDAFFNVINWNQVNKNYQDAQPLIWMHRKTDKIIHQ